jgi:aquaporin Z
MKNSSDRPFPWRLLFSELVGTALRVLIGLSLVTVMFGTGSPIAEVVPNEGVRRLITGFLFGTTGALIALQRRNILFF